MLKLTFIDWIIIGLYFVFILLIGWILKDTVKTDEDFFLAGRRNSAWVAGLAFISANLGSLEILGWTGASVKYGMLTAHFYWIGAIPAMIFLGLFMMKFYYHSKILSVPTYLKYRFDEKTRALNAISFAIMTILMSGVNIYLMALIFKIILGWNWHVSIWVSALTVMIYVALGGLMSAIFTEVVQFFLIWFGLFLVAILAFADVKGFSFLEKIPENMAYLWRNTLDPSDNAMGISFAGIILGLGFVLSFGYWTTDFLVVQRAFSAKDLRSAQLAPIIASFFKMALPFIVTFGGMICFVLMKEGEISLLKGDNGKVIYDSALPALIARYYPAGLAGLGIVALLAGFMAGQAGNITAFNTVWTYDIWKALIRKKASERELVVVGRIATVVGILLSVASAYWAMRFPTIMDYIQAIFSWVNAPLFATILLGMFWKRTTPDGAFWGLLAGMLTSFFLFVGIKLGFIPPSLITFTQNPSEMSHNLWRAWWAWLSCFLATVLISLFTKPKDEKEIEGLVVGLSKVKDADNNRNLLKSPWLWGSISFLILLALNIIFF